MDPLSEESTEHNSIIKQESEFVLHTGTENIRVIKEEPIEADDFIDESIDIKADLVKVEDLLEIKKELDVEIKQECILEKTVPKLESSAREGKMAERIRTDIEYAEELSRQFNQKEKRRRMKHFMRNTFETSQQAYKRRKRETKRMRESRMLRTAFETEEEAEVRRARVAERMRELRMMRKASETEEEATERKARVAERMKELRMIKMAFETEEETAVRKARLAERMRELRMIRKASETEQEAIERKAKVAERMRELRMLRRTFESEKDAERRKKYEAQVRREQRKIIKLNETEEEKRARKAKVSQERRDERFVREVLKDELEKLEKETGSCSDNIVWFSKPHDGVTAKQTKNMRESEDALRIDENYEMQASLLWARQNESLNCLGNVQKMGEHEPLKIVGDALKVNLSESIENQHKQEIVINRHNFKPSQVLKNNTYRIQSIIPTNMK